MGNTQPHNKTGRKVVEQKLENARKTGVLSLSEHKLEACPKQVFEISKLTTLDLSKNKLKKLNPNLSNLKVLKSLNVDHNKLEPGSLHVLSSLPKLKTLSANHNALGRAPPPSVVPTDQQKQQQQQKQQPKAKPKSTTTKTAQALPETLPKGLRTISLSHNFLTSIPKSIVENSSVPLTMLEILDLSSNRLARVPDTIASLTKLTNLNLDDNLLTGLSDAIGTLKHLKCLSLRRNHLQLMCVAGDVDGDLHPQQSLPKELWTNTPLIDLNLHGNPMTTTQLNTMDGYDVFLSRRREVKNKDILGGAMTDLEGCGLE